MSDKLLITRREFLARASTCAAKTFTPKVFVWGIGSDSSYHTPTVTDVVFPERTMIGFSSVQRQAPKFALLEGISYINQSYYGS